MKSTELSGKRVGLLTAWASSRGGGVAEAVLAQAGLIRTLGGEPVIFALADSLDDETRRCFAPTPVVTAAVTGPALIGFAPTLTRLLCEAELDLLHLHGIWMYPSRAAAAWATNTGLPFCISPHGMLDPWIVARGRWKKALARAGYERRSWASASLFHALTVEEASDIARESGRSETVVIPNPGPTAAIAESTSRDPTFVYLGRIHPKKNVAALIAAWCQLPRPAGARLLIAGWGADRDVAGLHAMIADADDPSISFLGAVYGDEKKRLLQSARFVVLPSLSEGLPMVILEAWAAGTPTIMSDACHLPQGFAAGAALRCGTEVTQVGSALQSALSLNTEQWLAMSHAGLDLARGPFSAETVAQAWGRAYCAMLTGQHYR